MMDKWLSRYAELTEQATGVSCALCEGSGAAGGLGFAFLSYLGASLCSGAETVARAIALESKIEKADILITGEGRLDAQSFMGKAPVEAAKLAKAHQKRVIAFVGSVSDSLRFEDACPIDAAFPLVGGICTQAQAMDKDNARRNMVRTAEQTFRLLKAFDLI